MNNEYIPKMSLSITFGCTCSRPRGKRERGYLGRARHLVGILTLRKLRRERERYKYSEYKLIKHRLLGHI